MLTSIKDKLDKAGVDVKKLDGWIDEPIFVGKEENIFVLKNGDKTKVIKNG